MLPTPESQKAAYSYAEQKAGRGFWHGDIFEGEHLGRGYQISTKATVGAACSDPAIDVPQQRSAGERIKVDDIPSSNAISTLRKNRHWSQRDSASRQDCRAAGSHRHTFDRIGKSN